MDAQLPFDDAGVVAVDEAARAGVGPRELRLLVRAGALRHLSRGWYAVGSLKTPEAIHLARLRALERTYAGTAAASHHTELLRLGLPTFRADLGTVHLVRTDPSRQQRSRPGVRVHGAPPPEALLPSGRVRPELAVVQHGLTGSGVGALCAADAALRAGMMSPEGLAQAVKWVHRHPRSAHIAAFVALADARSESVGESRLRHVFHLIGVRATPQVTIRDGGFVAIVDFLLDSELVVVEFDGLVKYGREQPTGRMPAGRDALVAEKRREDRLRELGYVVIRVIWSELDDLAALAKRIRAAIALARRVA